MTKLSFKIQLYDAQRKKKARFWKDGGWLTLYRLIKTHVLYADNEVTVFKHKSPTPEPEVKPKHTIERLK